MADESNSLLWNYLSVEVAVKLYELLDAADEDARVYAYVGEAEDLANWLRDNLSGLSVAGIEDALVAIFQKSLDHQYEPESFKSVAEFVVQRVAKFRSQDLI
jgi:hypothetical protein